MASHKEAHNVMTKKKSTQIKLQLKTKSIIKNTDLKNIIIYILNLLEKPAFCSFVVLLSWLVLFSYL